MIDHANQCPECEGTFDTHVSRDGRQGCCPHCGEKVRGQTRDPAQGSLSEFATDSTTTCIILVGCGAAKRDESAAARDLYTSTYAGLKGEYAEEFSDEWAILSAEHGIVEPDEVLDPYDTSISDLGPEELEAWADDVLAELEEWIRWALSDGTDEVTIELLAGQQYLAPIRDAIEQVGYQNNNVAARFPFDDTNGIGDQMGWLSSQIQEAEGDGE